jgi:hypothetical protein
MSDAKISGRSEAGGDPPDESPSVPWRSRWSRVSSALPFAALALFLAAAAYPRMFAILVPWDDEGYFLISLRSFRQMGGLYDRVYSQYGPLYFLAMDGLFRGLGIPIDHDHGRLVSLALWAAASGVCGYAVARLARSAWIGCGAQILVFAGLLLPMPFEPMHPAALLALLLAGLLATALLVARRPRLALGLQGALVAAVTLVKINVGAFAFLAVALAAATAYPDLRRRRAVAFATAGAVVLAPAALMAGSLGEPWVQTYALVIGASLAALALVLWVRGPVELGAAPLPAFIAGSAGVGIAVLGAIVALGTTPRALIEALLIAPFRLKDVLLLPAFFPPYSGGLALLAPLVAAAALWRSRGASAPGAARACAAGLARIAAGAAIGYSGAEIGFPLAPLAWVAALPPRGALDPPERAYARHLLPSLALLQTLQAYPVAGSHVVWGSFLLVLVGALCIADGLRQVGGWLRASLPLSAVARLRIASSLAGLALTALLAGWVYGGLERDRALYRNGVPLRLPGSSGLRLPPAQAETLQWVSDNLRRHCEVFVGLPGLPSFYFWTRQEPPDGFNAGTWMYLFAPEVQARTLARIRDVDRVCVVRSASALNLWNRDRPLPPGPLVDYLLENFTPAAHRGDFTLLARRKASP